METTAALTLSEMTKHIRGRLRHAGLNVRVKKFLPSAYFPGGVYVISPSYEETFSDETQAAIRHVARCNGLRADCTGAPIGDYLRSPNQQAFYYMPAVRGSEVAR